MACAQFAIWKEEPLSPLSNEEVTWLSDDTFYQTSSENDANIKFEDGIVPCESKAEVASLMLENLENLINLDELIKEEPFLLDEKILPILEDVEQPAPRAIELPSLKAEYGRTPDTSFLLKEFETVYDCVEFSHETLTPPQSPPGGSSEQPILTTLEPLLTPPYIPECKPTYLPDSPKITTNSYPVPEKQLLIAYPPRAEPPATPEFLPQPADIAHELAVVDELVRTRVEDMQWANSPSSQWASGPSSPNSSSCGSSNFGDCSSDADPEWTPESAEPTFDNNNNSLTPSSPTKAPRKRSKPYSRSAAPSADKKSRKKEQNKNAATRYRMKKKAEVEVILTEERELTSKNEDLENKISDMQREIKYLKGLMRDLFRAKGLIN